MYQRVIPRDLFNESKLLKCLGQLSLLIHDNCDNKGNPTPTSLSIEHNTDTYPGFDIDQNPYDGDMYCRNVNLYVKGNKIDIYHPYNSKACYPLSFEDEDSGNGGYVFNDDGSFSKEFLLFVEELEG